MLSRPSSFSPLCRSSASKVGPSSAPQSRQQTCREPPRNGAEHDGRQAQGAYGGPARQEWGWAPIMMDGMGGEELTTTRGQSERPWKAADEVRVSGVVCGVWGDTRCSSSRSSASGRPPATGASSHDTQLPGVGRATGGEKDGRRLRICHAPQLYLTSVESPRGAQTPRAGPGDYRCRPCPRRRVGSVRAPPADVGEAVTLDCHRLSFMTMVIPT